MGGRPEGEVANDPATWPHYFQCLELDSDEWQSGYVNAECPHIQASYNNNTCCTALTVPDRRQLLTSSALNRLLVPCQPPDVKEEFSVLEQQWETESLEQHQAADALDAANAEVDAVVAAKSSVAHLEEARAAAKAALQAQRKLISHPKINFLDPGSDKLKEFGKMDRLAALKRDPPSYELGAMAFVMDEIQIKWQGNTEQDFWNQLKGATADLGQRDLEGWARNTALGKVKSKCGPDSALYLVRPRISNKDIKKSAKAELHLLERLQKHFEFKIENSDTDYEVLAFVLASHKL